ncbi:hypothetical protein IAT38_004991 [Cryptococcus sp. DSM 104549]
MSEAKPWSYTVRKVETPEDMAMSMAIRKEVFVDEQGYDISIETNNDDARSTHFIVVSEDGDGMGTIRVIDSEGQLGRFALRKQYRGQGLGRPLMEAVHEHVKAAGGKQVWCHSQAAPPESGGVDATGFYLRFGYVAKGDLYYKEGTLHQKMVYTIA